MNLITKKSDARGALRNAGWSDKDILDVIPLASTTREPLAVGANDSMAATFQPSATPATASEELHRKACEALWDGKPAHASERLTDGDLEIAVDDICGEVVALTKSRKVDNLRNQIRAVLKNWWKLANTLQPAHASEQGVDATEIDKAVREVLNFHPWSYRELYKRMVKMCYDLSQRPTPATACPVCHKSDQVDNDIQDGQRWCHRCNCAFGPLTPAAASEQVTPSGGGKWTVEDHSDESGGAFVCDENNKPIFWCSKPNEAQKAIDAHNQSLQKISPDNNKPRKKPKT